MDKKYSSFSKLIIHTPIIMIIAFIVIANIIVFKFEESVVKTDAIEHVKYINSINLSSKYFANMIESDYKKLQSRLSDENLKRIMYSIFIGLFLIIITYLITLKVNRRLELFYTKLEDSKEEQKKKAKELQNMLYIDALTSLPNRKSLKLNIEGMKNPKLILIDIDGFKNINEFYDNEVCDFILVNIAKYLEDSEVNLKMKLYKISVDEFALLEDAPLDIERYEEITLKLVKNFKSQEIYVPKIDEHIEVNATIGISLESEGVFLKAFTALNYAKRNQKDYAFYMKVLDKKDEFYNEHKWSNIIKEAINKDQITPYFQPIFSRDGKIYKYECLARIVQDNEEIITPGLFLETSRKVRQYANLSKILIDKSFEKISKTDKDLSFNLLARDMMDSDISNYILDKAREYDIIHQLVFEILEDEDINTFERVLTFIQKAKRMGIRIAIDDFGTGYSNFSYLLKINPDYIKVDGSIIKNIDKDKNSLAILKAIISFTNTLGMKTIAEFIHSKDVYEKCYELGVDEFQGFYLGEPTAQLVDNKI